MGCLPSKSQTTAKSPQGKKENPKEIEEYVEDYVCEETEMKDNEMKVFDIKDAGRVLLIKQKGKIHALGTKCTHYGAPLVNGALGDGRLRCQWHGACFNIETGDIEDFPGLDSLPCHQVTIENNKVKIRAKRSALENQKRIKLMCKKSQDNNQQYVIIGGGPAGAVCVETLRQEKFAGFVTMICKENHLPYDRVKISKVGDFNIEQNQLRTKEFYEENDINVIMGVAANKINSENKEVFLENGQKLKYDKLFIATGSYANMLNIPGNQLKNIITLRNYEDGKNFASLLSSEKNVVVSGSSFIAMEAVSYCLDKVKTVTVISRSKAPFINVLGEQVGLAFMKLFESKGVVFQINNTIKEVKDDGNGNVGSVELQDGTVLKTEILVLGVGGTFSTDFLKESGIDLRSNGSIEVNGYLQTNVNDIFAGGDIAFAPVFSRDNEKSTIGHFPLAHYHGKIAALNMLGKNQELRVVPYFWTTLFGKSVRYCGHGSFDEIIFAGNVEEFKFVAFYINKKGEVVAASSCGMDPIVSQFAEYLYQGKKLHKTDLEDDPLSWLSKTLPEKEPISNLD